MNPSKILRQMSLIGLVLFSSHLFADDPGVTGPLIQKDVTYLEEGRTEKLDIYSPPGNHAAALPAVLLIHGGGWTGGDKALSREINMATTLAAAGYEVFSINYLLAGRTANDPTWKPSWPQNLFDCKSALRFMRKNAQQYGIDTTRIAVMGESAGGHLALLLGTTAHNAELNQGGLYADQSNNVSCVIDFYGIPDLTDAPHMKLVGVDYPFRGHTEEESVENRRRASPITYIDAATPPTLIVHGTTDQTVPIAVSQQLVERLKQVGVTYQYVEVPGAGHAFNLQPKQEDLRPIVLDFLKKYLGDSPTSPQ